MTLSDDSTFLPTARAEEGEKRGDLRGKDLQIAAVSSIDPRYSEAAHLFKAEALAPDFT